jgi:predicted nuclease with TOPRIM domain
LENERNDAEEEWANKLQERVRESEKLRRAMAEKDTEYNDVLRTSREREEQAEEAEGRRKGLERELNALKAKVEEAKGDMSTSADAEVSPLPISNLVLIGSDRLGKKSQTFNLRSLA